MGVFYQILGTGIICYLCMSMGLMFAWPSATLKIFESANTTLHRPMQESELALFGSLSSIGALTSTPVCGYLLDRIGRKYTVVLMSLTHVIAWAMIAACNHVEVVLTAVFISGIGGAVFLAVPVYVSEICQESIRGAMTSGSMISYGLGLLVSYLLGGLLEYKVMIYVSLSIAVFGVVSLSFLKESPTFLMMKGLEEEAANSIAFYRNIKSNSKEVLQELDSIRRAFNPDLDYEGDTMSNKPQERWLSLGKCIDKQAKQLVYNVYSYFKEKKTQTPYFMEIKVIDEVEKATGISRSSVNRIIAEGNRMKDQNMKPEEEKLKSPPKSTEKLSLWQFIKKSKPTRRAIIITLVIVTLAILQGIVAVQVYAEPLFDEAVPNLSAMLCSVLMAVIIVVVGFVAAYLTDLCGRKPLMVYASMATGLCCVVLGTQLQFHWAPQWTTALFIYLFCTAYTFGAGTVPYVMVAEVFLPEVKSFMSMLVIEWAWLCNFVVLFIFNPLVTAIGLGPIFYIFSCVCFLSAGFCIMYQPETKGMPVDAIQILFLDKRSRRQYC